MPQSLLILHCTPAHLHQGDDGESQTLSITGSASVAASPTHVEWDDSGGAWVHLMRAGQVPRAVGHLFCWPKPETGCTRRSRGPAAGGGCSSGAGRRRRAGAADGALQESLCGRPAAAPPVTRLADRPQVRGHPQVAHCAPANLAVQGDSTVWHTCSSKRAFGDYSIYSQERLEPEPQVLEMLSAEGRRL